MINKIVILGGGSAGWLTAGILAARLRTLESHPKSLMLVESPDVPTIGVGEGTWPTMRTTLSKIGISETDFIRSCSASFKQGSQFVGWRQGGVGDSYYHPFTIPQFGSEPHFYSAWQNYFPDLSFGQIATVQCAVCERNLAPKQISTPEYAGILNYGYHLDAGKFGELLKKHCKERLGVQHVVDNVVGIKSRDCGDIAGLETENTGLIEGDLFVDCSGSHSLLLGEHYKISFVDKKKYSPNDRALAVQVPYGSEEDQVASATIATAQSSGWIWDIGLSSRRGVGYVYSSSHIDDADAETELRSYLDRTCEQGANQLNIRKLEIRPGHREKFWYKNCLAIGMSAGFIEPLEASALALVELSANMLRDELPMSRESMNIVSERFNRIFTYRWDRIVEFLKLHYVLSERRDSEYWREVTNVATVPDGLQELLSLWRMRPPTYRDLLHVEEIFPFASYQYVLYGMGFKTETRWFDPAHPEVKTLAEKIKLSVQDVDRYIASLPNNRDLLSRIALHGLKKV